MIPSLQTPESQVVPVSTMDTSVTMDSMDTTVTMNTMETQGGGDPRQTTPTLPEERTVS